MENNQLPFHLQLHYERILRGWSQADVAEKVGSDVKSVGRWESGMSVPRPFYRQKLYEIFGKNAETMGLLEQSSHTTLPPVSTRATLSANDAESVAPEDADEAPPYTHTQVDWGEAPRPTTVYGRVDECTQLQGWIQQNKCRVVAVLGIGGIGKTTLLSVVAEQEKAGFRAVFWRSLHNAPSPEQFLKSAIRFLGHQQHTTTLPESVDDLIELLMQIVQHRRCLLVMDNFESVMQAGQYAGLYQPGYEGYGKLLQRVGETQHESCLLLTSREKPKEIVYSDSKQGPVRTLTLSGVGYEVGQELLQEQELVGSEQAWRDLIQMYSGNPLALKLVAQPIRDVFGGRIANFLVAEESVFGGVTDLLNQQFQRLSFQEQDVLMWLAIEREAVALETIRADMLLISRGVLIETLVSLLQRSLIETRETALFTLQPVVMEYLTTRLVQRAYIEFHLAIGDTWKKYAFIKAQAKDYVRANQIRLILAPIARHILATLSQDAFETQVRHMLDAQREKYLVPQAYVVGNILNLLVHLHYDLHTFDFSHLTIQQAYLQDVTLAGANFTEAHFIASVFRNTFGNVLAVTFSPDGRLLAVGIATGEIWVYDVASGSPLFSCMGHTDGVWAVAFSPDMRLLASSSDDQSVRIWSAETGECVRVLHGHTDRVRTLAFHPDGTLLASGSDDTSIVFWEVKSGRRLDTLQGHRDRVWSVAFSHDGRMLATGSTDQTVILWNISTRSPLMRLSGHTNAIRSLAFSPDDRSLVSGSDDKTVMLWDVQSGGCSRIFQGHSNRVWSVTFSGDGVTITSGSEDQTICIWDISTGKRVQTLQAHTQGVRSVAYSNDAHLLASGGDDQTIRLWETSTGHCLKTLQGYTNRIWSVLFAGDAHTLVSIGEDQAIRVWDTDTARWTRTMHEQGHGLRSLAATVDGTLLASGGEDQTIHLWNFATGQLLKIFRGHTDWVGTVAFSASGDLLASGSEDTTVRLWETHTGVCLYTLTGHSSWVRAVTFSPDGRLLASCGDDQTIRLWNTESGKCLFICEGHTARVRSLAFHPGGQYFISGSEDQTIRVWDSATGHCLSVLQGHTGRVRSVTYSPDGSVLCSGSDDQTVRLWESTSGTCVQVLRGHTHRVRWVAFEPQGNFIASSSDDGSIKIWDVHTASCVKTLLNERPYERMNITNVQGLTETQKATLRLLGAVETGET